MNIIDLFAGAGGFSLGFEKEEFNTLLGIEKDKSACKTFRFNIPAPCLERDLTKITPKEVPVSKNQTDIIIGGPPCQDFSVANYYSRGGERTNLVFVFSKWVEFFEPEVFVMENVAGITSVDNVFDELVREFENNGYKVNYRIINALNCGAPQSRRRMFIVGSKNDEIKLDSIGNQEGSTVEKAFKNLPKVKSGEKDKSIPNHRAPNHKDKTVKRIENSEWGEELFDSWSEKIRLDPNKHAPTLKAGKRANYHFGHPYIGRGLTVRERARLQTFPDNFVFKGSITDQRKQTGNAVPPIVSQKIARKIKNNI